MQDDDANQPTPSESVSPGDKSAELDDEQLQAVSGGTTIASSTKSLSGKKPADSAQDQAATMTAIALAESGGRTG